MAENSHKILKELSFVRRARPVRKHAVEKTAQYLIFYVGEFGSLSSRGAQRARAETSSYPQVIPSFL